MSNTQDARGGFQDALIQVALAGFYLLIGLFLGGCLAWWAGESPLFVVATILDGAFGTAYDFGMVLYFTTILISTGLAVAIPLQTGNFNIGAEGQTIIGAFAAGVIGAYAPTNWPHVLAITVGIFGAIFASGMWGAAAAAIRAFRGGHEVIASIMLNFVAAGTTGWLVASYLQAPDSQNPETLAVGVNFQLIRHPLFNGAPVTIGIIIAVIVACLFWVVANKMRPGFLMKAVKQAPEAAIVAGYNPRIIRFWAFTTGAAVCGLAGAVMVLGESWRFRLEISDGFGFLGIPVALLGRGKPIGVIFSAFLFASLHHGASLLDIESAKVGRDLAQVIEALVVLSVVVCPPLIAKFRPNFQKQGVH